jgi:hypothetical protein
VAAPWALVRTGKAAVVAAAVDADSIAAAISAAIGMRG